MYYTSRYGDGHGFELGERERGARRLLPRSDQHTRLCLSRLMGDSAGRASPANP